VKVDYLLKDYEHYHSDFQIDNFIIGSQGSDWFKFKQCLREIKTRRESLETAKDNKVLFQIKKKSIIRKIRLFFMGQTRRQIFLKNEKRTARGMHENIRETERELNRFVALAIKLKRQIGDIDPEKRKALEAKAWFKKARQMAAIEMLTQGRPSKQTMEFIISLPKESRKAILIELKSAKPESILKIE